MDVAQHLFPFFVEDLGLLGRRWVVGHLFFGQDGYRDLTVRPKALQKLIDAGRQVFLLNFTDSDKMVLHQLLWSSSDESVCGLSWRTTVASRFMPLRV